MIPNARGISATGGVFIGLVLFLPGPAAGAPTIDLSWDQCSPIVSARMPASDPAATLYVSATGLDVPHSGFHVRMWFSTDLPCRGSTSTPDAWRFDAEGCQGLSGAQVLLAVASKTCPPAAPPVRVLSTTLEHITDPVGNGPAPEPVGGMRVDVLASYAAQTPDPSQRYLLYAVRFDHTFSVNGPGTPGVSCGGYESPLCFALYKGVNFTVQGQCGGLLGLDTQSTFFRTSDSQEVPFLLGHSYATFGLPAGTGMSCFEIVPAEPVTWGAIKSQYH
jgi:hypothetical protein